MSVSKRVRRGAGASMAQHQSSIPAHSSRRFAAPIAIASCLLLFACASAAEELAAQTIIHSYTESMTSCFSCEAPPTETPNGTLYGTTTGGGANDWGTIYRIKRGSEYQVMHEFTGALGGVPQHGLVQASDGNLYGVTSLGGQFNEGVLYRFSPRGRYVIVDDFGNGKGKEASSLMQASDGRLYGTTTSGGRFNEGTIFRVNAGGRIDTVFSFSKQQYQGLAFPSNKLVEATDGNLYGVTYRGGVNNTGAVYRFGRGGDFQVVYSFGAAGSGDGNLPNGPLTQGTDGALYGVTYEGGASNYGTVFRLTLDGQQSLFYEFSRPVGIWPQGPLARDELGNLYGTAQSGGPGVPIAVGTAFRIAPDGVFTRIYAWNGSPGGSFPSGLTRASDGRFYGLMGFDCASVPGCLIRLDLNGPAAAQSRVPRRR
jgi:uncharacterized repeat protein (TIGR03803 family)